MVATGCKLKWCYIFTMSGFHEGMKAVSSCLIIKNSPPLFLIHFFMEKYDLSQFLRTSFVLFHLSFLASNKILSYALSEVYVMKINTHTRLSSIYRRHNPKPLIWQHFSTIVTSLWPRLTCAALSRMSLYSKSSVSLCRNDKGSLKFTWWRKEIGKNE